ncbi:MAG: hypothetical protein U5J83_00135 [Bryobacterales bacterium]|nr:hypothetical protein [Bryobacterales bacterium]
MLKRISHGWLCVAILALPAATLLPAHDLYLYDASFSAKPGSAAIV